MSHRRLIDCFPSWMTGGGIFSGMSGVPWDNKVDKIALDMEYFGNRSGLRKLSPILEKMTCFPDDHILSDVEIVRLQKILKAKFLNSWTRVWAVLVEANYKPLENYDMEENEEHDSVSKTDTDMKTATNVNASSENKGTDSDTSIYAFNASGAVPTDKVSVKGETVSTADEEDNFTHITGDGDDNKVTAEGGHKLTRHGNIGVTTSQQMLQSELDLRRTQFFDIVFKDVDSILTRGSW